MKEYDDSKIIVFSKKAEDGVGGQLKRTIIDMKDNNLYLAELYVGKCRISSSLPPKLTLSFRIGKSTAHNTTSKPFSNGQVDFDVTLQLNTDQLALDTQRGSLTLSAPASNGQTTVLGMALIPLSKEVSNLSKKLKLTQCADRGAEIQITLTITPLDSVLLGENNMGVTMRSSGVSSCRSIMEMQDFDRKPISPPRLFPFSEKDSKLMPPKPSQTRSAKEFISPPQEVVRLQGECQCLKELLRVEIKKSDASGRLIDSLVSALEELNTLPLPLSLPLPPELDETLLLEEIERDDLLQKTLERNVELEKEVANLRLTLEELRNENRKLQEVSQSTRVSSREAMLAMKEPIDKKAIQRMAADLSQLQQQISAQFDEMERYKKKMKLSAKIPTLDNAQIQRSGGSLGILRAMTERLLHDNRELTKTVLKLIKQQADLRSDGLLNRMKQRIDRTFGSLIAKKMNRDIVIFEKAELVKALEEIWAKAG